MSTKLIDKIIDQQTLLVQYDPYDDGYDLLIVNPSALETLYQEYKDMIGTKKVSTKILEDYFGMKIVLRKDLSVAFKLERDI